MSLSGGILGNCHCSPLPIKLTTGESDNGDKRFIMFPSHLFYRVGGISHDSFDRQLRRELQPPLPTHQPLLP